MFRYPPERALERCRIDPAGRIGTVDQVADLGRGVADRPERVGDRDRVVDRRRVVGDDLDDRVARIEEREVDVVHVARHVDDDHRVDPAQQREDLLDVARGDHLGHLDPGRGQQDVDARRVAPEDIAQVGLGDPVGRQVEDRGGVGRHLQEGAQVAELETAVDEDRALVHLPDRHREVERDGRLAHPALGREDREGPRARGLRVRIEKLADAGDAVDEVEAGERHRQHPVDALCRIGLDGVLRHGQDDDRHAETGLVDLVDEARALDPALQQRIHDHDVGTQLLDLEESLAALAQHVKQLDLALCVEEATDVLRDLRHVLDDQQACLVTRHQADDTTQYAQRTPTEVRSGG